MRGDDEPKVSVIIPTYQEGRYIGSLLRRLAGLKYPTEIIVVDSGSTDGTVETAKLFTENVYKINQRGIAKARNYGACRSNGEILVFLDADVTPPSDFVEKTLRAFQNSMVVGATCNIVPRQPRILELFFFGFYNKLIQVSTFLKPHSRGEFLAMRRKCFLEIGGFNEHLPCVEDHDLALRVSRLGKFVFISELSVYESMRRVRKLGILNVLKTWVTNYVSFILLGRTITGIWKAVR